MRNRSRALFPSTVLLAFLCTEPTATAQDDPYLEDVRAAEISLRKGKHSKARSLYEDIFEAYEEDDEEERPGDAAMRGARHGLLRLELIHGRYAQLLRLYGKMSAKERDEPRNLLLASRARQRTGKYEEAVKALRGLVTADKGGYEARYRLGIAIAAVGDISAARKVFEEAIAAVEGALDDPMDLCYVAKCHMELGGRTHMETAAGLLAESINKAPDPPEARVAYAQLHFDAYRESKKGKTAESKLKRVFENNGEVEDALVLMYRSRSFNMFLDGAKTASFLERALSLNSNSVPAIVLRAKRLVDDRLFESAVQVLDRALGINPRDRVALSHRATVAHLLHDDAGAKRFRERAMAKRPGYAEIDRIFGDHLSALYRFKDSVPYFRAALQRQPDYVAAMHGLAKALVYLGKGKEAVGLLTKAKDLEKGHADTWRHNILLSERRLAKEYDLVESDHFLFMMHKSDRAVLERYLTKWYEDAYEYLGRKYGYKPKNQIRVEVLHEWVDFSVRTIGFRGFSALGACFGEFVTMVSPSDPVLRRNDFMWSATAWHEYAHVLTLALSKHRVPRWLTEGMSVYEESAKNPSWERGMVRELLDAYHNEDLPPLRLLNRLFRGDRILFGYYQGGLIVEFLAEHHGFGKVVSMLKAYGEDKGTEQIMRDTFGMNSREFDRRFKDWVKSKKIANLKLVPRLNPKMVDRLRSRVQIEPGDVDSHLKLAWHFVRLVKSSRGRVQHVGLVEAGIHLGAVLRKKPDHPMAQLVHAELLLARKQSDAAFAAYERGFKAGANDFESRLHFADLLVDKGDLDAALAQYQSAKACWPHCTDQALAPQLRISTILRKQGKLTEAMMETKSFCKTTARAFKPRMELAAYEKKLGNRKSEAQFLEECVQIDPFMRTLHDRLGDAYIALGKLELARGEFEVALAVPIELDRALIDTPPQDRPEPGGPDDAEARGALYLKLARVCWALKDPPAAFEYLDRAQKESPESDLVDDVHELRAKWKSKKDLPKIEKGRKK